MVTTCGFTLPLLLLMNHNQHLSSSIISLTFLFKRSKSKGLTASSFKGPVPFVLGFPNGKESACQGKRCRFVAWVGKIPRKRAWQPTPAFLPGGSHGQRNLAGYSPLCNKESDTSEHTHTHPFTLPPPSPRGTRSLEGPLDLTSEVLHTFWPCSYREHLG